MFDSPANLPRISFGMIVLNGEPFIRYNLRALYPFAHEIIVVEGAVKAAAPIATQDGHSTDTTLETLKRFKEQEDPYDKIKIITRNGYWREKDEQSQAFAKIATGDYLWQIDVDEFYMPEDMQTIIERLAEPPKISAVSFIQLSFWGGFDYISDGWYLHQGGNHIHRVFRWGIGYRYSTHRPPTVLNSQGQDVRSINWLKGTDLARKNIWMYHYPLIFPKQVQEKSRYYDAANWVKRNKMSAWANDTFMNLQHPFHVHNVYDHVSWLEKFAGENPPQIKNLAADIKNGRLKIQTRQTDDIEKLLQSPFYRTGRLILKTLSPLRLSVYKYGRKVKRKLRLNRPMVT